MLFQMHLIVPTSAFADVAARMIMVYGEWQSEGFCLFADEHFIIDLQRVCRSQFWEYHFIKWSPFLTTCQWLHGSIKLILKALAIL